jgi:Transcriptional antiterminator
MVSTPLVLEAVRKCSLCDTDLNSVYTYLCADFRGYTSNIVSEVSFENGSQNAIITICSTGKGAAMKLKELVEAAAKNITGNSNIEVIPCGLKELKKAVKEVSKTSNVISLVGISDPKLGIPFISIEALIDGSGEEILRNIIKGKDIRISNKSEKQIVLKNLCKQSLIEFITFLNPEKIYSLLEEFVNSIEKSLDVQYSNPTKLRIMIHLACALERMLLNSGLTYDTTDVKFDKKVLNALMETKSIFQSALSITLTDDEIYHMVDIVSEN